MDVRVINPCFDFVFGGGNILFLVYSVYVRRIISEPRKEPNCSICFFKNAEDLFGDKRNIDGFNFWGMNIKSCGHLNDWKGWSFHSGFIRNRGAKRVRGYGLRHHHIHIYSKTVIICEWGSCRKSTIIVCREFKSDLGLSMRGRRWNGIILNCGAQINNIMISLVHVLESNNKCSSVVMA